MKQRGLWLTLAAVLLVRLLAPLLPGSWLWGWDELRDAPNWAWFTLAVAGALLAPPVAGPLQRSLDPIATRVLSSRLGFLPYMLAAPVLAWLLPDQLYFVGDFFLRQASVEHGAPGEVLFPQYLPLDRWLHHELPAYAQANWGVEVSSWNRWIGALEAGLLAAIAASAPRWLRISGLAGLALAGLIFWGGWLALFTGLAKGFSELVLLTAAAGALGLRALRDERGRITLSALLVVALFTHRAALALLPAALWAIAAAPRIERRRGWVEAVLWLAPAAALVMVSPKLFETLGGVDAVNFGFAEGSAPVTALLAPLRWLDLQNLLALLVPCLAIGWLVFVRNETNPAEAETRVDDAGRSRRNEKIYWTLWLAPHVALIALYRPPQGIARDFDGLAAAAMALAVFIAISLAQWLAHDERGRRWVPALLWLSMVPTVTWLWIHADMDRGLDRVRRLADGPPLRVANERAQTYEFIGSRLFEEERYAESAQALGQAVEQAPSPRYIAGWAEAAKRDGDWPQSERAYTLLLERSPEELVGYRVIAHLGLGANAGRRGELETARHHLEMALHLAPGHPAAQRLLAQVERQEALRNPE